jgi:hypothetical protein
MKFANATNEGKVEPTLHAASKEEALTSVKNTPHELV